MHSLECEHASDCGTSGPRVLRLHPRPAFRGSRRSRDSGSGEPAGARVPPARRCLDPPDHKRTRESCEESFLHRTTSRLSQPGWIRVEMPPGTGWGHAQEREVCPRRGGTRRLLPACRVSSWFQESASTDGSHARPDKKSPILGGRGSLLLRRDRVRIGNASDYGLELSAVLVFAGCGGRFETESLPA